MRCCNYLNFGHLKDKCPEESLDDLIAVMKEHEKEQRRGEISSLLVTTNESKELLPENLDIDLEPGEIPSSSIPPLALNPTPTLPLGLGGTPNIVPDSQPGFSASQDAPSENSDIQVVCGTSHAVVPAHQHSQCAQCLKKNPFKFNLALLNGYFLFKLHLREVTLFLIIPH